MPVLCIAERTFAGPILTYLTIHDNVILMNSFEITTYDATTQIPAEVAAQVSSVFALNYPSSHSQDNLVEDVTKRIDARAVQRSLDGYRNNRLFVASLEGEGKDVVTGFIEARTIDDDHNGTYEQLTWIITDAEYRGQHVASLLHGTFIIDASLRAFQRMPKPTLALLSVHQQNIAAKAIYEGWGYGVIESTLSDKLLMTKTLPVNA